MCIDLEKTQIPILLLHSHFQFMNFFCALDF
jgi:hypothetical protein